MGFSGGVPTNRDQAFGFSVTQMGSEVDSLLEGQVKAYSGDQE